MKYLKWFIVNALFLAFFVLESHIPVTLFNGIFFLLWLVFLSLLVLVTVALLMVVLDELPDKMVEAMPKWSKWYWLIDGTYDLAMIIILAGMGHYAFALLYYLLFGSFFMLRQVVKNES